MLEIIRFILRLLITPMFVIIFGAVWFVFIIARFIVNLSLFITEDKQWWVEDIQECNSVFANPLKALWGK